MSVAASLQILVSAQTGQAVAALRGVDAQAKRTATSVQASGTAMEQAFGRRGAMAAKGGLLAVAAGLYSSIKVGVEFERQMSALEAVTGASGRAMEKFEKQALSMSEETIFGAREVAQAQTELAKGGLSVQQILGGALPAALSLAAAGELDLATAAKTVTNAMNLFGLSSKSAISVADMLATAANTTTADVSDFAMALTQGGAAAKQAGWNLNQTVTVLELLAEAGVKNSDAGTSMKTALLQLLAPTEKQAALAKELNLEFVNQRGELKGAAGLYRELEDATEGMTRAQRAAVLKVLAGTDGFRTLSAILDGGAKKARELSKANKEVGTSAETAAEKTDNLAGDWERLKGQFESAAIGVYHDLEPALRVATQAATEAVGPLSDLSQGIDLGDMISTAGDPLQVGKQLGQDLGEDIMGGIGDAVSGAASTVFGRLKAKMPGVDFSQFGDAAKTAFDRVKGIASKGANIALGIGGDAVGKAKSIWNKVRGVVGKGITFALGLPGSIVGRAKDLWGKVKGVVGKAISIPLNLASGIVEKARALWDRIDAALPDISINVNISGGGVPGWLGTALDAQATGTSNFKGGPAIVNELGPEMGHLNGMFWMLGNGNTGRQLTWLPKGADVFTHTQTRELMAAGIPAYKGGRTKAEKKAAQQRKRERKIAKREASRASVLLNLESILAAAELTSGFSDDITAINNLLGYWRGVERANKGAAKIKNPLKRKAGLEKLLEARTQIKSYTEMLADLTGGTDAGLTDAGDAERAALLQELLNSANLRTAVSQAQYGVFRNTPVAAPSFAGGTPGSSAKVAVYVHEGGRGADVYVNDRRVEAAVERVNRRNARTAGRGLPSRGGA